MSRVFRHLKDAAKLQLPSEEDDEEAPDGTLGKTVGRMWIDLHGDDADKEVRSCLFNLASLLSFLSPDSALHPEP